MATFHPDHDENHGYTVRILTNTGKTIIGRWDHQAGGQVFMNDVALHIEGESEQSQEDFVKHCALWGVQPTHKQFAFSAAEMTELRKLGEIATEIRGW